MDQFYGLLAFVQISDDDEKSRAMNRLLRQAHFEKLARIEPEEEDE